MISIKADIFPNASIVIEGLATTRVPTLTICSLKIVNMLSIILAALVAAALATDVPTSYPAPAPTSYPVPTYRPSYPQPSYGYPQPTYGGYPAPAPTQPQRVTAELRRLRNSLAVSLWSTFCPVLLL
jgi:hypothetical protein